MKRTIYRWLIQSSIFILIFGCSLFLSSGQLDWNMAWAFLLLFALSQAIVGFFLVPHNPELVEERTHIQLSGLPQWDRPLSGIMSLFGPMAMLIVAGLDKRLGWTTHITHQLQVSALGIAALGSLLTIWAMVSNRFFYARVRIEKERGHSVATSGPYQAVRHPGYAGAILFYLATPLLLGSLWAFIPTGVTVGVIVLRTALEDRTLTEGLEGYGRYAQQVRHRLLPWIW
jgi:protein-S-isoprenylcysteine O-methyltransferase Ste14